jgi:hypothetical protein
MVDDLYAFASSVTYKKLETYTETMTLRRRDGCIHINIVADIYVLAPSVMYKKLEINTRSSEYSSIHNNVSFIVFVNDE